MPTQGEVTEEETIRIFDPRDTLFKQYLLVSGTALLVACVCGLGYEVLRPGNKKNAVNSGK